MTASARVLGVDGLAVDGGAAADLLLPGALGVVLPGDLLFGAGPGGRGLRGARHVAVLIEDGGHGLQVHLHGGARGDLEHRGGVVAVHGGDGAVEAELGHHGGARAHGLLLALHLLAHLLLPAGRQHQEEHDEHDRDEQEHQVASRGTSFGCLQGAGGRVSEQVHVFLR